MKKSTKKLCYIKSFLQLASTRLYRDSTGSKRVCSRCEAFNNHIATKIRDYWYFSGSRKHTITYRIDELLCVRDSSVKIKSGERKSTEKFFHEEKLSKSIYINESSKLIIGFQSEFESAKKFLSMRSISSLQNHWETWSLTYCHFSYVTQLNDE